MVSSLVMAVVSRDTCFFRLNISASLQGGGIAVITTVMCGEDEECYERWWRRVTVVRRGGRRGREGEKERRGGKNRESKRD